MIPEFLELRCGVRHYAWGERRHGDRPPFIAELCGLEASGTSPYAELWIGAHPSLPAEVRHGGGGEPLNLFVRREPAAVLGARAAAAGQWELPFLLKILSCERALSIQAHPDPVLAARLHAKDPKHYPDSRAKPEVAIALTPFDALVQFRPVADIRADIARHAGLRGLLAAASVAPVLGPRHWLRNTYAVLLHAPAAAIAEAAQSIEAEIRQAAAMTDHDRWFLKLQEGCPNDRGGLSLFFLNLVHLLPGEAVFIGAGEPHAYLHGTIVECMANSDNVIRAGLTSKFMDTDVLLEMLTHSEEAVRRLLPVTRGDGVQAYVPPASEFEVQFLRGAAGTSLVADSADQVSLLLVLKGEARLRVPHGAEVVAPRGSTWLWPACLGSAEIAFVAPGTEIVRARPNQSRPDVTGTDNPRMR